jgi:hypothetical protein
MGPQKSCPKKRNKYETLLLHTYPGRLAYIHAHPLMIVGIDTIAMMAAIGVREEGVGRNRGG